MSEYEFISKLGDQKIRKFGSTQLVKDKHSGDLFVQKTIEKRKTKNSIWERLKQEAGFNFNFPGLPELTDFSENQDSISTIRPYVEGVTINHYFGKLKRKERLPFLKKFIEKLTPIFDYLSDQNIVHCDIKPSNILINGSLEQFDVYLIDFGLALNTEALEERKILFPLGYAAPELLLNHLDLVDQRSDIFALGILIWKLFTEELPLRHPNPSIYTNLQLTHPLPDHIELPKGLFSIVSKMTSKYQFKLPPNKLSQSEVRNSIQEGMANRYKNLTEVSNDLNTLKTRIPFYQRISFR
ncbi:MAG: serine/threonine protein kinase [Crocinitomicaceae bacterium]